MTEVWLLCAGLGVLVVLYMTYPRFLRRSISAARFFKDLPPPRHGQSRLRFGKIQFSLPFFLQFIVLLLLLMSVFLLGKHLITNASKEMGVWLIVDTSASMGTLQQGKPRMELAVKEVEQAVNQALKAAKGRKICFRLSTIDLERRDLILDGEGADVQRAASTLAPRPLGTNLGLIRSLSSLLTSQSPGEGTPSCGVSHLLVISDHPAPSWLEEYQDIAVVWRDVGERVDNLGITAIRLDRNPLDGQVREMTIEITAYGALPLDGRLLVSGENEQVIMDQKLTWQQGRQWQGSFSPATPGTYRIALSPGGAYHLDDSVQIHLDKPQPVKVDWQLKDQGLLKHLGWQHDPLHPQLRVTAKENSPQDIPTLVIGPGYGTVSSDRRSIEIRDFVESSPLLSDINLDVVETLSLPVLQVPGSFESVLRGVDGSVWLAQAKESMQAIVTGIPTFSDDVLGRFSAAVFFNALRWLLQSKEFPPLFSLTSPQHLEPGLNRFPLHPGESNTQREPHSSGTLEDLKPLVVKGKRLPLWPLLFVAAVLFFLGERAAALFRQP